jgi:hypothetical protein
MKTTCKVVYVRGRPRWCVEVDRPVEQGGPFTQLFRHDDLFTAARMANKWRRHGIVDS